MAGHYYVSSVHGTQATGASAYTSQQTGAMTSLTPASQVYGSFKDLIEDGSLVDGDFIYVADNHVEAGANVLVAMDSVENILVVSVDSTAIDTYKRGGQVMNTTGTTGSYGLSASSSWFFYGCDFNWFGANNGVFKAATDSQLSLNDCTITNLTSASGTFFNAPSNVNTRYQVQARDCTFAGNTASGTGFFCVLSGGRNLEFTNCVISDFDKLVNAVAFRGGGVAYFTGCEITNTPIIVGNFGASAGDNTLAVRLSHCHLDSSYTLLEETRFDVDMTFEIELLGSDNADSFNYHKELAGGTLIGVQTPYIAEQEKIAAATPQQLTLQVQTYEAMTHPLRIDIPIRYDDYSSMTTATLKIATSGSLTLNDADIQLYIRYADSTDPMLAKFAMSGTPAASGRWAPKPRLLYSGSSLTSGTDDWTGTVANEYRLSCTLSSGNAAPSLIAGAWVFIWCDTDKDNAGDLIYLDSEVVLS